MSAKFTARLNPCRSSPTATREKALPSRRQPINESNLILFGRALNKTINELHRQIASQSANLDSSKEEHAYGPRAPIGQLLH
jgi:hypothetical protein